MQWWNVLMPFRFIDDAICNSDEIQASQAVFDPILYNRRYSVA